MVKNFFLLFNFIIILTLSFGCQTIKEKSDQVAAKENEKFGLFVGKQIEELRLELGAPTEDFINDTFFPLSVPLMTLMMF